MNNDSSLHSLGFAQRRQWSTKMGSSGTSVGRSLHQLSCAVVSCYQITTSTWEDTKFPSRRNARKSTTASPIGDITLSVDAALATTRMASNAMPASSLSDFIDVATLIGIRTPCCGAKAHSSEAPWMCRGYSTTYTRLSFASIVARMFSYRIV